MTDLATFVTARARRGECTCGLCADRLHGPEEFLGEHTVSVGFFDVALTDPENPPDSDELLRLVREHESVFGECDPLDGEMHDYIGLGGFIGDQGLALMLIGLGKLLDVWGLWDPGSQTDQHPRPIMSTSKELLELLSGATA